MQSQLLGDSRVANTLIPRVCNAVLAAPSSTRHVSHLPASWPRFELHAAPCRGPQACFSGRLFILLLPAKPKSAGLSTSSSVGSAPPQLLVKWWAEYPAELLESRVVKPLQRYLTDELYATKKLTIRWGGRELGCGGGHRGGLAESDYCTGEQRGMRWEHHLDSLPHLACSVMNVIKVLAKVEEANQLGRQLPPEAFYNELIR